VQKHFKKTCVLLSILPWTAHAATLEQAMNLAVDNHPAIQISAFETDVVRAQMKSQTAYAYNPDVSLEYQDRKLNGGGTSADYYIGISQGIEFGSKHSDRNRAAKAGLQASLKNLESLKQTLKTEAAKAYVSLSIAKQTLAIRSQQTQSYKLLGLAVKKRMQAGDANILDANLAQSAYATALSAETKARQDERQRQIHYMTALNEHAVEVNMALPRLNLEWLTPQDPLNVAKSSRADFAALQEKALQAEASADLADANRYSDPTVSLMKGREAGEALLKLGVSFALPFTDARKGDYQASLAQALRDERVLQWFEQKLALDVQAAVENHSSAIQSLKIVTQMEKAFDTSNSESLAQSAYEAGEISIEDLVLHINQALDARLTKLNMLEQSWLARIQLAQVLGHPEYIIQGIQQ